MINTTRDTGDIARRNTKHKKDEQRELRERKFEKKVRAIR